MTTRREDDPGGAVIEAGPGTAAPAATPVAAPAPALTGAACLSNGTYRVLLTALGTGRSSLGSIALTRWSGDAVEDRDGFFVHLVDRARDAAWSVTAAPAPPADGRCAVLWTAGSVTYVREEHGIEARLTVAVHPERPLEIRRVTLVHHGDAPREIEIASALEVVLHEAAHDRAHPAFSRLFIETQHDAGEGALLARRRPRGGSESFPWLGHAVLEEPGAEFESDRARFLGRVADRARPAGLADAGPWAGAVGNVLDPVFALRVRRTLLPGVPETVTFVLAAADDRGAVLDLVRRARAQGGDAILSAANARGARVHEAADLAAEGAGGLPPAPPAATVEARFAPAAMPAAPPASPAWSAPAAALEFANGYGGFAPDGREYVLRFDAGARGGHDPRLVARPPLPWVNVIANEDFGTLVSETGAGATWSVNSRERRLSPWSNDTLLDPHGEAVYVRDEDTGAFVSPLPGPATGTGPCETRHGFGVTRFTREAAGLAFASDVFVPRHDPVKLTRVTVRNTGAAPRRLVIAAYQRLVLGDQPPGPGARAIATWRAGGDAAAPLLARAPGDPLHAGRVAFAALLAGPGVAADDAPARWTCDRAAFLGAYGSAAAPRALADATAFDGKCGDDLDPCFAQARAFTLAPGASATWTVAFGDGADEAAARALVDRLGAPGAIDAAHAAVTRFWDELVSAVAIETPAPALDRMVNGWLAYQTVVCRLWGRTAFYQSGGAFGFRDQLQDASAMLHYAPAMFREQILRNAAHQFVEGDVLHWWHPPDGRGLRTRFADDLLWLPWLTAAYVRGTGDTGVLAEPARFVTARPLEAGEQEVFLAATTSGESADVYEHCIRAIERSLAVGNGAHGLPLFGCGDWNDGMNRVGHDGKGESVWMAFFLHAVLADFAPLVRARGDVERADRWAAERARLSDVLEKAGWDGAWYRRGYYDDGTPLGTASGDECRIDALAQAWATLSRAVPRERAEAALDAVETHLVSDEAGMIRLLDPPFDRTAHDPGYIKGYTPGVRENGGQYTHAALWVIRALAESGRRGRAAHLLELLSPVSHAQTAEQVAVYQVEPYVVAADVYGAAPHVGRGGWTWYTGSAGWMLRVALESVLGVTVEDGTTLVVRPCIPDDWPGFRMRRRLPDGSVYAIDVRGGTTAAGSGRSAASEIVLRAALDGVPARIVDGAARIPLAGDGREHTVTIQLGPRA